MKKQLSLIVLVLVFALALSACGCKHETWNEATCELPKTCAACGKTEGEALGHMWQDATCENPETCEACGKTEGEALGHKWEEATCETAKTCSVCAAVEGEALGHSWEDATTESPKTCTACAATEGERIVTDPRFTTAATKDVQGTWVLEYPMGAAEMGLEGFDGVMNCHVFFEFHSDGTWKLHMTFANCEEFQAELADYITQSSYAELEAAGISKEEGDAQFKQVYGMTIGEYAQAVANALDFNSLIEAYEVEGVYYVEEGLIYSGDTWDGAMDADGFTVTGDTLTIEADFLGNGGENTVLQRVPEA